MDSLLSCPVEVEKEISLTISGCVNGKNEALGLKLVSLRPKNPQNHSLPTIPAQVLLVDPETSQPLVLMDATYLTLLRTAAGSGVATRFLARKDIKKLVIFGAGNQAQSHLEVNYSSAATYLQAMLTERPSIQEVVILNRTHEKALKLVQELKADPR